jgi:hypothetical protein
MQERNEYLKNGVWSLISQSRKSMRKAESKEEHLH